MNCEKRHSCTLVSELVQALKDKQEVIEIQKQLCNMKKIRELKERADLVENLFLN